MAPFSPKEVTRFLLWIVIFAVVVIAMIFMLWHATGRTQIQPQPTSNLVFPRTLSSSRCPEGDLNPHDLLESADFKSAAYADK